MKVNVSPGIVIALSILVPRFNFMPNTSSELTFWKSLLMSELASVFDFTVPKVDL